jgi:hypothetical protein
VLCAICGETECQRACDVEAYEVDVRLRHSCKSNRATQDRRTFASQFCREIADAIRGEVSKVQVLDMQISNNTATVLLQPGVCGGNMTPVEASRLLLGQVHDMKSTLRKGK